MMTRAVNVLRYGSAVVHAYGLALGRQSDVIQPRLPLTFFQRHTVEMGALWREDERLTTRTSTTGVICVSCLNTGFGCPAPGPKVTLFKEKDNIICNIVISVCVKTGNQLSFQIWSVRSFSKERTFICSLLAHFHIRVKYQCLGKAFFVSMSEAGAGPWPKPQTSVRSWRGTREI